MAGTYYKNKHSSRGAYGSIGASTDLVTWRIIRYRPYLVYAPSFLVRPELSYFGIANACLIATEYFPQQSSDADPPSGADTRKPDLPVRVPHFW